MDVHIEKKRRKLQMQNKYRMAIFGNTRAICLFDGIGYGWGVHKTPIDVEVLTGALRTALGWCSHFSLQTNASFFKKHFKRTLRKLLVKYISDAMMQLCVEIVISSFRRCKNFAFLVYQGK